MTWKFAPPEIRERVNRALGQDVYETARVAWERAIASDPQAVVERFFSTPREHYALRGAARESQHLLGLAVDVVPSSLERYRALAAALEAQGFWVKRYPDPPGPRRPHLHAQVFQPSAWQEALRRLRAAGVWPGR